MKYAKRRRPRFRPVINWDFSKRDFVISNIAAWTIPLKSAMDRIGALR